MIYVQTRLKIADNSGALSVKCIKILNTNKNWGSVGDLVLVAVKKINPKKKIVRKSLHKGVIVRVVAKVKRDGGYIRTGQNAIVLLNNQYLPLGTRIFGPLLRELYLKKKYAKILSLATYIV